MRPAAIARLELVAAVERAYRAAVWCTTWTSAGERPQGGAAARKQCTSSSSSRRSRVTASHFRQLVAGAGAAAVLSAVLQ